MPNTEVKLTNAESTWPEAAREDRKLLIKERHPIRRVSFYMGNFLSVRVTGIGGEHLLKVIGLFF